MPKSCRIEYMCTKFGVGSSSRFRFRARTHRHRVAYATDQSTYPRLGYLPPASVTDNSVCTEQAVVGL